MSDPGLRRESRHVLGSAHVNRFECVGTVLHIETDGVDDGPASVQCCCNRRHVCDVGLQRRQALGVLGRVQVLGSTCGRVRMVSAA